MRRVVIVCSAVVLMAMVHAQESPLTPKTLESALAAKPQGAAADQLAARIRSGFGDALPRGAAPKVDELSAAWAVELPAGDNARAPRVVSDTGSFSLTLARVGSTGVYAGVATLSHGTAFTWHYEVGDRRLGGGQILPEVEKTVRLRHDGASRAISGSSSGGICAFTVAWERPNEFSKVLSWVGSFTNIASGSSGRDGGHNYEAMVRKTPRKPIRVFLQDGANDRDNANGNWPLANQTLARSLAFAGYDYRFEYGQGFHSTGHGRAILPDSLRWLWRDWRETLR